VLLDDASFKIPDGATAAIVGPNGAGKTTLLRMLAGDVAPTEGTVAVSGGLGVMRQFIGGPQATGTTVRDLLLSVSPQPVQAAARNLDDSELEMMERDDERTQLRYAKALNDYAEAGGYDQEARRDRIERLEELRHRWDEEHEKIKELVRMYRVKASHNSVRESAVPVWD
jgi:ATPase subunit of ABC transporter with duplicated ATPase domains